MYGKDQWAVVRDLTQGPDQTGEDARIVDVAQSSLTVEVTGPSDKIDSIVGLLKPYGIKEMVRTGLVVMSRGATMGQEKGRDAVRLREVS